ncbi:MAG: phage Gp37/Gp68 family protein [Magnetococcales bacterium]|nr:phage Gp37/Gp68 family protein [Magnetococcales bacterium]
MGKDSKIDWTHHTFNPWWGCAKVSAGCANCYAEVWAARVGMKCWGVNGQRRFFGDSHWHQPMLWNRRAAHLKERQKVFCSSMADVFEARKDLDPWREKLWGLIAATPWLDWLLVTKRHSHVLEMAPWKTEWPSNVWLGMTAEDQECAARRLPLLLKIPAKVRFISCEPLVGPLDVRPWVGSGGVDWIIVGGESGARARRMQSEWVEQIQSQCQKANTAFFFKQWGVFGADGLRRSKKKNGNLFQDRLWQEFPIVQESHIASCHRI